MRLNSVILSTMVCNLLIFPPFLFGKCIEFEFDTSNARLWKYTNTVYG